MNSQSCNDANLIVVLGPTASGKTSLGVKLAHTINGEIISADSRQVYRGLDIGSGKDLHEYGDIPYHLIDIVDPGHEFNVFEFQKRFCGVFSDIHKRKKRPIMVGGTGLYLDSILNSYRFTEVPVNDALRSTLSSYDLDGLAVRLKTTNPNLHNTTDLLDKNRLIRAIEIAEAEGNPTHTSVELPEIHPLVFGITWSRSELKERIKLRLDQRIKQGLVEEVEALHRNGVTWETLHFYGLEYRFVAQHLQGNLNKNDMTQKLNAAIVYFAKQQEKWFRRMERKGTQIHWFNGNDAPFIQAIEEMGESLLYNR